MVELSIPELSKVVDAGYWAVHSRITLANGATFSFKDRPYLIEPMACRATVAGAMKATGGGFSECMGILPSIHGMIRGRYPQGVGYFFPTDTDMQDYVKSRFNPLIHMNSQSIGRFLRKGNRGTDSAGLKRIGNSNLYLRGSTLNPGDESGDTKKSTKLQGIQFDRLVVDEKDQVDPDAIGKMRGRMGNAEIDGIKGKREERYIANPSDEDRGIDLDWQRSNQFRWNSKCTFCGTLTDTLREFIKDAEGSIGIHPPDGSDVTKGYMKCRKCGKPLGYGEGEYVADYPSVKDVIFYQWSHLASIYHNPARILRDFRNPPEGNLGDVYRLDLGLPYSSKDEKLKKDVVFLCCGSDSMSDSSPGPCAMGVDNDDGKHVVIGTKIGPDEYEILKTARVDNFNDVHDLGRKFNVRSAVVDLRPNADSARDFQKAERYKVLLNEYTESPLQDGYVNENTGIIKTYRTGIFDRSHKIIANGKLRLPRRECMGDFAEQVCNCVKSKEIDKKRNQVVYRYKKTGRGNDHYRNAFNYFLLAASGHRIAKVSPNKRKRQLTASLR